MKRQFNPDYLPQIKSGKYKVETADGHQMTFLMRDEGHTDFFVFRDEWNADVRVYNDAGGEYCNEKDEDARLVIITPEPKITAPKQRPVVVYTSDRTCIEHLIDLVDYEIMSWEEDHDYDDKRVRPICPYDADRDFLMRIKRQLS